MVGRRLGFALTLMLVGTLLAPTSASPVPARYAMLVRDIGSDEDHTPSWLVNVGGTLFFTADDGTHGRELWKSDGTPQGTVMVKDIRPGAEGSGPAREGGGPSWLIRVGGSLFFRADDGTHGRELWKSDGTPQGTVMVKDIRLGAEGSIPGDLAAVGGTLFFGAEDGTHGRELWRSDGTPQGTVMIKDINSGPGDFRPEEPMTNSQPASIGGILFFEASDGETNHGVELWKSDGTAAGTAMVKDIRPGAEGSRPQVLTNVGGTLFFAAENGTSGVELWKSDGTSEGTAMVKDIRPGAESSILGEFAHVAGTLFFTATDGETNHGVELWKSDGTSEGTVMVKDIRPGPAPSRPGGTTNVRGTLFFRADDGTHGWELWKSDGTADGTMMVKDINTDPETGDSIPFGFTDVKGTLFFNATDNHGAELWTTDGTADGTVMVKDINPGGAYSWPSRLTAAGGMLFFVADDGTHGYELWKAGTPWAKSVKLSAKPRRVAKGSRAKLTAVLTPCPAASGHSIRFQKKTTSGWKTFAVGKASSTCSAAVGVRINRGTIFRATSPRQAEDHLGGVSNSVRVRIRAGN